MQPSHSDPRPKTRLRERRLAQITESCTGCAGSPICRIFCSRAALILVDDPENHPFKRIRVDSSRCNGCGNCTARRPENTFVSGCPWNAIRLVAVMEL